MAYPSLVDCPVCMTERKIHRDTFLPHIDQCRYCGTWFCMAPGPINPYMQQPHPDDYSLSPEDAQTASPIKYSYVAYEIPTARLKDRGTWGDRVFDHRALIAAYLQHEEYLKKPGHQARAQYWGRLYHALSKLYGVDLAAVLSDCESASIIRRRQLTYFRQTLECYMVLKTPFEEILGGTSFEPHMCRLMQLKEETKDACIDLFARIFQDMFGEHQPVFTFDDLRREGFYGGGEPGMDPDFAP